jgi:Protein of unknown function (DUF2971)
VSGVNFEGNEITISMGGNSQVFLYHYCSLDTFQKIVTTGKLWASELHYLNDSSEIGTFCDAANIVANEMIVQNPNNELLRQFVDWIKLRRDTGPLIFASSLSKDGNLLSQWRAYCLSGAGISIGFLRADLEVAASLQGYSLINCSYDFGDASDSAREFLKKLLNYSDNPIDSAASHPTQKFHKTFYHFEEQFFTRAAVHKHYAFSEEAECRLVSKIHNNYVEPDIRFRASNTTLVPYQEFALPRNSDGTLRVANVYIGPTNMNNQTFRSVSMLMARQGIRASIVASMVPLRSEK